MTGPEHYRAAELLLRSCQVGDNHPAEAATYPAREDGVDSIGNALLAAQAHATLALAAAAVAVAESIGSAEAAHVGSVWAQVLE